MKKLELLYRLLLTAYPADHRRQYEDEMVSVLLESVPPGRRWPRLREAFAIVAFGLGTRVRSDSELRRGLRLVGPGAVGLVALFAAAVLSLSARQPVELTGQIAAGWLVVLAVAIHAVQATWIYRAVPASALSLAMMVVGASGFGLRRSMLLTVATLLILAAAGPRHRRSVGAVAAVTGCGAGAILGSVISADMDRFYFGGTERWMLEAQWGLLNDSLLYLTSLLSLGLLVAGLLTAAFRMRYLVAAVPLALTTLTTGLFLPGRSLWSIGLVQAHIQTVVLIGLATLALGLAVTIPERRIDGPSPDHWPLGLWPNS